jgi:hypothetical protein
MDARMLTAGEYTAPRIIRTVYHLADAANWPSIRQHGLMSARRLIDLHQPQDSGAARRHRPTNRSLAEGVLIRDQKPMPPKALARCLRNGLEPEDWYELLNSKVFFWMDPRRLNRQRLACKDSPQIVLVLDATRLLLNYCSSAAVTPINTGNARRRAAFRNVSTFVAYQRWRTDGWEAEVIPGAHRRDRNHRPVELAIPDAVPDVIDYLVAVVPLGAGETLDAQLPDTGGRRRGT